LAQASAGSNGEQHTAFRHRLITMEAAVENNATEVVVGGKFRLGSKIGSGSFGAIHLGVNLRTGEEVAIKLEPLKSRHPQLLYEAKIYKNLAGSVGIPSVHWYGVEGNFTIMVLDLLGPSLEDLLNFCNGRLSLKTVLMIADQMINRLECAHSRNIIHRDVKPDNFLLGLGRRANQVNLIDFGLSKKYRDSKTQLHIPYREGKALTGTARYASINTHAGLEQSRRDDLEALGYVLIYLVKGCLPWQGLPAKTKQEKYDDIMQLKIDTDLKDLCKDLPGEFEEYLSYCKNLGFEDRPDYGLLRGLLRNAFAREGFQLDFVYDWSLVGKPQKPRDPPPRGLPEQQRGDPEQRDKPRRAKGRRHHRHHDEQHEHHQAVDALEKHHDFEPALRETSTAACQAGYGAALPAERMLKNEHLPGGNSLGPPSPSAKLMEPCPVLPSLDVSQLPLQECQVYRGPAICTSPVPVAVGAVSKSAE